MRNRKEAGAGLKSEETRLRILTAALELFREKGFEEAAYYYFESKDAIVLAFYQRATEEMAEELEQVLVAGKDLRKRLSGVLEVKLRYFEPSRRLLAALAGHVDPAHRLSPFSEQTREIRERDIAVFERALAGSNVRIAEDLKGALPRILWLYQMGLILYWIHDGSAGQKRAAALIDKSLRIVVRLLQLSSLPLMRPLRRQVLELYSAAE
jgi:AcrR family transcriptional regulator